MQNIKLLVCKDFLLIRLYSLCVDSARLQTSISIQYIMCCIHIPQLFSPPPQSILLLLSCHINSKLRGSMPLSLRVSVILLTSRSFVRVLWGCVGWHSWVTLASTVALLVDTPKSSVDKPHPSLCQHLICFYDSHSDWCEWSSPLVEDIEHFFLCVCVTVLCHLLKSFHLIYLFID